MVKKHCDENESDLFHCHTCKGSSDHKWLATIPVFKATSKWHVTCNGKFGVF